MCDNSTVLQPGVLIKPEMTQDNAKEILSEVYGLKCSSIKELNGYDDKNYHVKVEESHGNNYISNVNGEGYVLKIINASDSKRSDVFEAQNELLLHLGKNGVCCPQPIRSKNGQYNVIRRLSSGDHLIRLLEFISGSILYQVPPSKDLFYQTGEYIAKLDEKLKSFHHSAYDDHKSIWMLDAVPQLSQFLSAITDESKKKLVESVIEEFTRVVPSSSSLEKGIIHGDFNEQNILVEEKGGDWRVKGVLDFGDSQFGCYVFEIAITMTYMMIQAKSIEVGGYVLAGYTSVRKLSPQEYNVLKICVAARLCQSLVLGAYSILQDPKNSYILTTAKPGWALLEELCSYPDDKLLELWRSYERESH